MEQSISSHVNIPLISIALGILVPLSPGPILESKVVSAIFQKSKEMSKKGQNIWTFGQKYMKFENIFKIGWWLDTIITHNILLKQAMIPQLYWTKGDKLSGYWGVLWNENYVVAIAIEWWLDACPCNELEETTHFTFGMNMTSVFLYFKKSDENRGLFLYFFGEGNNQKC